MWLSMPLFGLNTETLLVSLIQPLLSSFKLYMSCHSVDIVISIIPEQDLLTSSAICSPAHYYTALLCLNIETGSLTSVPDNPNMTQRPAISTCPKI